MHQHVALGVGAAQIAIELERLLICFERSIVAALVIGDQAEQIVALRDIMLRVDLARDHQHFVAARLGIGVCAQVDQRKRRVAGRKNHARSAD